MAISGITNAASIQQFLLERNTNSKNRLYIKNGQFQYDENAGRMTLFAARLGFGSASMSNVSKFILKNGETCLRGNKDEITRYNAFIVSYNDNHCCCLKKATKIKMHELVKHQLAKCNALLKDSKFGKNLKPLLERCQHLSRACDSFPADGKITKKEKKALNAILEFKNEVRASLFPAKAQPLKGPGFTQKSLKGATEDDKQALRVELKKIRAIVLKKYFHERLKLDADKLTQLRSVFDTHKTELSETLFLEKQLKRWEKKHAEGKPIAVPKWYHCTQDASTVGLILDSHILYAKGSWPGVFVSNKPEVAIYGGYCLVLSDRIEKSGTKESGMKNKTIYPKQSSMVEGRTQDDCLIQYSDTLLCAPTDVFKNRQEYIQIWLGFQRGKDTLKPGKRSGTKGIPIERMERIRSGNLKYYKDTTLSFIFETNNRGSLIEVGLERRVQVITCDELMAMRALINASFYCTLPAGWQNNIAKFTD